MNRKALGLLGIAILVAMGAIVLVGDGGLPRRTEAIAKAELASLDTTRAAFDRQTARIERALADAPDFFAAGGYDRVWTEAIAAGEAHMGRAGETADLLRSLLEADDKKAATEAEARAGEISRARAEALAAVEPAATEADRLLAFRNAVGDRLRAMASDVAAIEGVDLGPLRARVKQAAADWPNKEDDLERRFGVLDEARDAALERWADSAEVRARAETDAASPEDLISLARDAEAIASTRRDLVAAPGRLLGLIDQLYWAWDRILADMEIDEGLDVNFRHLYRTVRTPVQPVRAGVIDRATETVRAALDQPPADDGPEVTDPEAAGVKTDEQWVTVGKAEYERMKQNLGMVVEHKDAGLYDHEAESMIQPAGYQYVAPYGQRNRYGYWRGGFWTWYGQYAFMRDVFWGRNHRIGRDDWNGYSRSRSTGATYYGDAGSGRSRYGSTGTETASRYSGSKYVRTGGFKSSRYVQSGGSYRGSRYASSTRSYGGARSGGYSRSGGRSGGK